MDLLAFLLGSHKAAARLWPGQVLMWSLIGGAWHVVGNTQLLSLVGSVVAAGFFRASEGDKSPGKTVLCDVSHPQSDFPSPLL